MQVKTRKQLLKSPVLLDFIDACLNFIRIIEDEKCSEEEFLKKLHPVLCNLYVNTLPFMESIFPYPEQMIEPTNSLVLPENYFDICTDLKLKLGGEKFYREVWSPYFAGVNVPVVTASIYDDLINIYRELKSGLYLIYLDTESGIASGLYYLQNRFEHWGRHCTLAVRVIHYQRFEY